MVLSLDQENLDNREYDFCVASLELNRANGLCWNIKLRYEVEGQEQKASIEPWVGDSDSRLNGGE